MPENIGADSLPAAYRLVLAGSFALLLHTFLLSGLAAPSADSSPAHSQTVKFRLLAQGDQSAAGTMLSNTDRSEPQLSPVETATSVDESLQTGPRADRAGISTPTKPAPGHKMSTSAVVKRTGDEIEPWQNERQETVTRVARAPTHQDPYITALAAHLANRLEGMRLPAVRNLTETVTMTLKLQLLGNGALTRARIVRSTGIESLDSAAYRGALAASPYPQPPAGGPWGNRFEIELRFTPERL